MHSHAALVPQHVFRTSLTAAENVATVCNSRGTCRPAGQARVLGTVCSKARQTACSGTYVRPNDAAVCAELRHDVLGAVDGDGKAHSVGRDGLHVGDAHHFALRTERQGQFYPSEHLITHS
jgi:hypothetical protein